MRKVLQGRRRSVSREKESLESSAQQMGRPRKPLQVLEISGAARKNPQRYRARKAAAKLVTAALGDPPAEWTELAEKGNGRCIALLRIWNRIVAQDVLRVLNCSHWMLLKNICQLQWKVDEACKGYGKATSGDYSTLKAHYAALGMTPIDSSKVAEAVRVPERGSGSSGRNPGGGRWGELVG
jgi:hypothetical protein